jgi:hypothetical protein
MPLLFHILGAKKKLNFTSIVALRAVRGDKKGTHLDEEV